MLVDFVTIVAPFVRTDPCGNGDAHNYHALRPAEHDLLEELAWTKRAALLRTGRLQVPGFACVNCSGIAPLPPRRSKVTLDPGVAVPWEPPTPLLGRPHFGRRIVV